MILFINGGSTRLPPVFIFIKKMISKKKYYPQKNSMTICAVKIRRNIDRGYTVE